MSTDRERGGGKHKGKRMTITIKLKNFLTRKSSDGGHQAKKKKGG
jgi:hypothetical protein